MTNLKQALRKIDRLVEIAPDYVLHPSRVAKVAKGVHPGVLPTLDQPWLRALRFGTILDVGANTGQFSFATRSVFPSARMYAFEPLPRCFADLARRMKDDARFDAFQAAIGSSDGRIAIHESAASPSSSILSMTESHTEAFPWTDGGRDIEVDLRRLDSFLPELELTEPVFLKVDVQGYSMEVLRGAVETLKHCALVVVETSIVTLYEGESSFDDVYIFMKDAGFRFCGAIDQLRHPETDEILQVDAIFRRA